MSKGIATGLGILMGIIGSLFQMVIYFDYGKLGKSIVVLIPLLGFVIVGYKVLIAFKAVKDRDYSRNRFLTFIQTSFNAFLVCTLLGAFFVLGNVGSDMNLVGISFFTLQCIVAFIVGLSLFIAIKNIEKKTKSADKTNFWSIVCVLIVLFGIAQPLVGWVVVANSLIEWSESKVYEVIAIDKERISHSGRGNTGTTTYELTLDSSELPFKVEQVNVHMKIYEQCRENERVILSYHRGLFGMPWIEVEGFIRTVKDGDGKKRVQVMILENHEWEISYH